MALGNFTWDWIFRDYAGGAAAADALGEVYRRGQRAFRLPLCGGFETIPEVIDLPFIARRARHTPAETRARLGLPDGRPALVSFGGYGVAGIDLDALSRTEGWSLLVSASVPFGPDGVPLAHAATRGALHPLDEPALYAMGPRYEDVVAAAKIARTCCSVPASATLTGSPGMPLPVCVRPGTSSSAGCRRAYRSHHAGIRR